MNEEYVKIKDYPYYISNMGNVKNKTGRILMLKRGKENRKRI